MSKRKIRLCATLGAFVLSGLLLFVPEFRPAGTIPLGIGVLGVILLYRK